MTSLVAPKPSDGPTSPGLISYGSDPAALDDYLNLDLFGTRVGHSPASSHGALPVTPTTNENVPMDESMPFDGFNPLDKTLGAFDMGFLGGDMDQYSGLFQEMFPTFSEPASGPSAPVIDPQLFTAPPPAPVPPTPIVAVAPAPPTPVLDSEDEGDEDEPDEVAPLPTRTRKPKKNAAAAGGIAKRPSRASTPASVVPSYVHFEDPKPVVPPVLGKGGVASYLSGERIGSQEPDEWRPTPEEYKKLSSKEKRQLRNKISARNFRVRRKEYITTLESHIADRDQLIAAIRSELSNTHNENTELRREIDALKRAIQEGRLSAEATGLPPPRPLTPEQSASPATPSTPAPRRPTDLARANTQKDRSSDASGRSFWGGAVGHGGVTSVHTTLIPEVFPPQLSTKPRNVSPSSSGSSSASPSTPPNEGVNMNPLMNLPPLFGSSKPPASPIVNVGLDIMDQAFNQRTLEGFRAQLWGRMAKEAGARSVLAERRMEGVETTSPTQPSTSSQSPLFSPAPQSLSPQPTPPSQTVSPAPRTISSSPSLSMLNQPATLKSLFESASGRLFDSQSTPLFQSPSSTSSSSSQPSNSTPAPSLFQGSTPTPALLQASSFGAGFLGTSSSSTGFAQSAASMQARAMLQAQWLALQQSRQQSAVGSSAQPISSSQPQSAPSLTAQPSQREIYLAQFAQAAAAQQQLQQQQAQQPQLGALAAGFKPAYFASSKDKDKDLASAMSSLSLDKKDKKGTTPQQAAFAVSLASQTLLQRMGSAFWDAFSTGSTRDVDTNKVRRVLEGKAVVRVVDVDSDVAGLEERMKGMGLERGVFGNLRGKK
ncbi:hypothetical protein RSOLAG22IIIB_05369 [Rhizoctonia solani]|uniref:BZIP domain-containing protein n=1 Tax=Rhizoctonia solani TaxID=456999 RepID=A0A0K6G5Z6_9AGAM|nr:hypothetical protein RSOLAG22IIIB_05369 [Rhizoctonia solani]